MSSPATYYFDASDAGPTDADAVFFNDANAFDGSTATNASVSGTDSDDWGSTSARFLQGDGTNAPASGGTITQVRARLYGSGDDQTGVSHGNAAIYTDGLGELLGTVTNQLGGAAPPNWSDYTTLSTPSGGWTWPKVQALEVKLYNNNYTLNGDWQFYRVEIEVTFLPTISGVSSITGISSITT